MTSTSEAQSPGGRAETGVMRFAALGDSVTLGIGDQMPQGGWRGWAALLADSLAPPDQVELCNLARSGALIRDVASEQLPLALSVRPALASVLVGVNDTLRGKFDPAAIAADLEKIVAALQHAGTVVLTASLPDPGLLLRIPASIRRPLARRAHQINAVLGQLAVRYDLVHVDLAARPEIYDKRMWGVDRLHPSERGHRLLARMFAERLAERGMPPLAPPDPEPGQSRAERLAPGPLDGDQGNRLDGQAVPGPAAGAAPAGPGRVVARPARASGRSRCRPPIRNRTGDVTDMSDPGVPQSGTLIPVADPARPDFAELRRRIRQAGLMDRRPRYYAIKITVLAVLLTGGWAAFAYWATPGTSWWAGVAEDQPPHGGVHVHAFAPGRGEPGQPVVQPQGGQPGGQAEDQGQEVHRHHGGVDG